MLDFDSSFKCFLLLRNCFTQFNDFFRYRLQTFFSMYPVISHMNPHYTHKTREKKLKDKILWIINTPLPPFISHTHHSHPLLFFSTFSVFVRNHIEIDVQVIEWSSLCKPANDCNFYKIFISFLLVHCLLLSSLAYIIIYKTHIFT